jgi:hypothetical protein
MFTECSDLHGQMEWQGIWSPVKKSWGQKGLKVIKCQVIRVLWSRMNSIRLESCGLQYKELQVILRPVTVV